MVVLAVVAIRPHVSCHLAQGKEGSPLLEDQARTSKVHSVSGHPRAGGQLYFYKEGQSNSTGAPD